jgi:hypothetical protein
MESQWEYPSSLVGQCPDLRPSGTAPVIPDAGAGVTFLPYYLEEQLPEVELTCLNSDAAWATVYEQISRTAARPVWFLTDDLRHYRFRAALRRVLRVRDGTHQSIPAHAWVPSRAMASCGTVTNTFDINPSTGVPKHSTEFEDGFGRRFIAIFLDIRRWSIRYSHNSWPRMGFPS